MDIEKYGHCFINILDQNTCERSFMFITHLPTHFFFLFFSFIQYEHILQFFLARHARANLLQTGNFWLRTMLAIQEWVHSFVRIERGDADPQDLRMQGVMVDWFFSIGLVSV